MTRRKLTAVQQAVLARYPEISEDYVRISTWVDLGSGHFVSSMSCHAHYLDLHPKKGGASGEWCIGSVSLKGHGHGTRGDGEPIPEWDRLSSDPLTLSPSLLCRVCGNHGFIREGKWVVA